MKTLMRNGRDRRSENPSWANARKERVLLFGTDQRITSGPAAIAAASRSEAILQAKTGRIHGCTRTLRKEVRFFPCTAGAVHTWPRAAVRGDAAECLQRRA